LKLLLFLFPVEAEMFRHI